MPALALSTDFDSCIGRCHNYFVIGHTTPRSDVRGRPFIKNINWWKWSQRASDSLRRSLTSLFEWPRLRPWVGGALLRRCVIRNCRSQNQVPSRLRLPSVRCDFKYATLLPPHRHRTCKPRPAVRPWPCFLCRSWRASVRIVKIGAEALTVHRSSYT